MQLRICMAFILLAERYPPVLSMAVVVLVVQVLGSRRSYMSMSPLAKRIIARGNFQPPVGYGANLARFALRALAHFTGTIKTPGASLLGVGYLRQRGLDQYYAACQLLFLNLISELM
jgi:hypothetical protein